MQVTQCKQVYRVIIVHSRSQSRSKRSVRAAERATKNAYKAGTGRMRRQRMPYGHKLAHSPCSAMTTRAGPFAGVEYQRQAVILYERTRISERHQLVRVSQESYTPVTDRRMALDGEYPAICYSRQSTCRQCLRRPLSSSLRTALATQSPRRAAHEGH